jgi:hypothetical protein
LGGWGVWAVDRWTRVQQRVLSYGPHSATNMLIYSEEMLKYRQPKNNALKAKTK